MRGLVFLFLASFLSAAAHGQDLVAAKGAGGIGTDVGRSIAVDGNGNSYIAGTFVNTAVFGPGEANETTLTTTSPDVADIFMAKYDGAGALVWAKRAGGVGTDEPTGIAADSAGASYVVGFFNGIATFAPGECEETTLTGAGSQDMFIAKYDAAGVLQWAKSAGGAADPDVASGVVLGSSGSVYVTGVFAGSAVFGDQEANETTLNSSGPQDMFLARYDSANGDLLWAKRQGGSSFDVGKALGVDGAGYIYVAGSFHDATTLGGGDPAETIFSSGGGPDVFLAKYDSSGALSWARQVSGPSNNLVEAIAVDPAGNSYLTGSFVTSSTFDSGAPTPTVLTSSNGSSDIFVAKYDVSGRLSWASRAGSTQTDEALAIVSDKIGNSYLTGYFQSNGEFGSTVLASDGADDVFVAKYGGSGDVVWAKRAGGNGRDQGGGIAINGESDLIYLTGSFWGSATFGPGEESQTTLVATGEWDLFWAKFANSLESADSTTRVGVYNAGSWRLDSNGDGAPDDALFAFEAGPSATRLTGDWNGDGKDEIGLFINGAWFLDYNGNGFYDGPGVDREYVFGWNGVTPFVGDWDGDGGDKIGIYINGFWFLDADGDGQWDGPGIDIQAQFGWDGVTPFVGDWNGDGRDKIGIYINGFWFKDYNGNAVWDGPVVDRQAEFGWSAVTPFVGDWNGDGRDKIGIFVNGFWFLDVNGNEIWDGSGTDRQAQFGFIGVSPIIGDWNGSAADKIGIFINGIFYLDFDGSGTWDGGVVDKEYVYGQNGDTPTLGRW